MGSSRAGSEACGRDVGVRSCVGGRGPLRVTRERKPEDCRERQSRRIWLVEGSEVRASRALELFWRCEQTLERWTRDMAVVASSR